MKRFTDKEKYEQLKAQTEKAGMVVKEVDGKILVTRKAPTMKDYKKNGSSLDREKKHTKGEESKEKKMSKKVKKPVRK